jgi:PPOX class probable F420-dependent enzyme
MKLNDAARELIGDGTDATLVTLNADGSPQVTVVWMALESTPDGDELVSAHLAEYQKTRNIRRDPRVAVTILSTEHPGQQTPYIAVTGTARIVEGGAPALLKKLAKTMLGSDKLPTGQCAGRSAHSRPDREGGRLSSLGVLTDREAAVTRFSLSWTRR